MKPEQGYYGTSHNVIVWYHMPTLFVLLLEPRICFVLFERRATTFFVCIVFLLPTDGNEDDEDIAWEDGEDEEMSHVDWEDGGGEGNKAEGTIVERSDDYEGGGQGWNSEDREEPEECRVSRARPKCTLVLLLAFRIVQ